MKTHNEFYRFPINLEPHVFASPKRDVGTRGEFTTQTIHAVLLIWQNTRIDVDGGYFERFAFNYYVKLKNCLWL
jgi:hypothetical protein